ncbi:hypothetical protein [Bradyrhizobium arachidis]|uniref:hypothetical protein n=1 Tax=Bradyrhizobium arachidis TaxID=858423 RepID=UPI002162406C|nr:hypothetical protein [Bradyrhizobium arachidis]UVO30542.1 hypothetical protein KUF59_07695 [Bradyrhizobium arachidis]
MHAGKIAAARGVSVEDAVAQAIEESARHAGAADPRRRLTAAQMLKVGDEIAALPLLDRHSPSEIMAVINAL